MFGASRPVRATRQSLRDGSYSSSRGQYDPLSRSSVRNYARNEMRNNRDRYPTFGRSNDPYQSNMARMARTGVLPDLVMTDEIMNFKLKDLGRDLNPYGTTNIRELANTLNPLAANYSNKGSSQNFDPATSASGVTLQARQPALENFGSNKLKPGINYMTTGFNQGYAGTQSMNQELKNNPFVSISNRRDLNKGIF